MDEMAIACGLRQHTQLNRELRLKRAWQSGSSGSKSRLVLKMEEGDLRVCWDRLQEAPFGSGQRISVEEGVVSKAFNNPRGFASRRNPELSAGIDRMNCREMQTPCTFSI